ncbi:MAG: FkbM family methyltransferase [Saprospiraceae bacterium]|nr:FkbM family methyltransferase [Candidatus Brachybacter algidus]MBK8747635.1 FkbM family methyltransferase [Candidatus Brachybacter algidus]
MKEFLKKIVKSFPIDFTKNQIYDRQTRQVIAKVCRHDSNCIDVGCHKGEVMDIILRCAPDGKHFGFEPIPSMYESLKKKYDGTNCEIINLALSEQKGTTSFNHVVSNPAYSGMKARKYARKDEEIEKIEVRMDRLDNIIPSDLQITLIKIDVEGAEYQVLSGSTGLLQRQRPFVVFEHGLGASDFMGLHRK